VGSLGGEVGELFLELGEELEGVLGDRVESGGVRIGLLLHGWAGEVYGWGSRWGRLSNVVSLVISSD